MGIGERGRSKLERANIERAKGNQDQAKVMTLQCATTPKVTIIWNKNFRKKSDFGTLKDEIFQNLNIEKISLSHAASAEKPKNQL